MDGLTVGVDVGGTKVDADARHLTGRGHRPTALVVAAALGSEAGLIGAADLARRGHPGTTDDR